MIRAKITKKDGFQCAPQGHTVITIPMNEIVEGKIAEWALASHAASRMFDPREDKKVVTEVETKAKPKRRRKKKAD